MFWRPLMLGTLVLAFSNPVVAADCYTIQEAAKHVGEEACVTGTVLKIGTSRSGNHFLDFCEDYKSCPFTVVVFARDLRNVGDIRELVGKKIEIHGKIDEYNGRAEIILKDIRQLKGEGANIPPVPKDYDAARRGNFSAGKFSQPQSQHTPARKPQAPTVDPEEE